MSSTAEAGAPRAPRILCTGIIVLDKVFRVAEFPQPDAKVEAKEYFIVNGGCAANAAVAIARLGGRAALAGPLGGPAGEDDNGDVVLRALAREHVDTSACQRVDGLATALSAIFIDARGDRTIVTYRDERIAAVTPRDPHALAAAADLVLADNRYPQFARPICEAARSRGVPVVIDGDKATVADDPLFRVATHVIFSSECLRATTGCGDLAAGLRCIARHTDAFLAVSNGANDILCRCSRSRRSIPSAPAMLCTAASRWHSPKDKGRWRRCALARRLPGSSARASAAPPARPSVPKLRPFWPSAEIESAPVGVFALAGLRR